MILYKCDTCGLETKWLMPEGNRDSEKEPFPDSWCKLDVTIARKDFILHFCSKTCEEKAR